MNDNVTFAQNTLVQKTFSPKDLELKVFEQTWWKHSFDADLLSFVIKRSEPMNDNVTFAENALVQKIFSPKD
jgi:hypothetical protein